MSLQDAAKYLSVSPGRFRILIKNYGIPNKKIARDRIFLKDDLDAFQVSRKERLKHRRKF